MPNVRNSLAADSRPDLGIDGSRRARGRPRGARTPAISRAPDLLVDLRQGRDRLREDDGFVASASSRSRRALPHLDARRHRERDVVRRHGEVSAGPRRQPAHRIGLHSRHAEPDVLHLDAGRMRDEVRLLPDRQDGAGPQPERRRNRRTGPRAGRRARPARLEVQHRAHGHGRAAAQLRQHDEGAAGCSTTSTASPCRRSA